MTPIRGEHGFPRVDPDLHLAGADRSTQLGQRPCRDQAVLFQLHAGEVTNRQSVGVGCHQPGSAVFSRLKQDTGEQGASSIRGRRHRDLSDRRGDRVPIDAQPRPGHFITHTGEVVDRHLPEAEPWPVPRDLHFPIGHTERYGTRWHLSDRFRRQLGLDDHPTLFTHLHLGRSPHGHLEVGPGDAQSGSHGFTQEPLEDGQGGSGCLQPGWPWRKRRRGRHARL